VAEALEHGHPLLCVSAHRVVGGEVGHKLVDACADLVREVRRRRPDERVDVVDGRLGNHGRSVIQLNDTGS
jgi:hypothetical protein